MKSSESYNVSLQYSESLIAGDLLITDIKLITIARVEYVVPQIPSDAEPYPGEEGIAFDILYLFRRI